MADASVLLAAAQAHYAAGRLTEAKARLGRLLEDEPYHGPALRMLAHIAYRAGDNAEAARLFSQAAALALAEGDADAALQGAVSALSADETPRTQRLFADVASALHLAPDDPIIRGLMIRAVVEQWGPLAPLVAAAASLLQSAGGSLENDALLHACLEAAPIPDAGVEAALTTARHQLLEKGGDVAFAAALARQCFLNGYIYWQTEDETARVQALRARVEAALTQEKTVADIDLALLACYVPLHRVKGIGGARSGDHAMAALLLQQRDEPAEEARLAAALPALTPIVHAPAEDAAWPRWRGHASFPAPVSLAPYLATRFAHADVAGLPTRPALLAAGCGTGEYLLELARTLELESITAVDLSRANLGYAARKAREANRDMHFGQGDILQAAALDRKFGLIECGGMLHQLPDPLAGWKGLLAALEPGGVMRIAVHSKVAQARFTALRALVAAQGFTPTTEGIRAARHWLKGRSEVAALIEGPVYFSDGGCCHLLFGQDENPLTLAQIAGFLEAHRLALIGLDVAPSVAAAYRARFPDDPAAVDLDNWAAFEQDNPETFTAMIQFWIRAEA